MEIASDWKDYEIIATGNGEKLERWKNIYLLRPDPQVIWDSSFSLKDYAKLDARYIRNSNGGGYWENRKTIPTSWKVSYKNLTFKVQPMGFKHTGLFPEQAVNWDKMISLIKKANRPIKVLNLFGYTGGATVACVSAGAFVCHVDAAKAMVDRCGENLTLSSLREKPVRLIVDDCIKFVLREIKRGNKYDAIIMDPPSYGRGPGGEMWKIEKDLFSLVNLCTKLLTERPLFYLINSYTTGLQPAVLHNLLSLSMKDFKGKIEAYEVCLKTNEKIVLPCGASGMFIGD